jgi:hypothetical protein
MPLEVISQPAHGDAKPTPLLFVHGLWHGAWCWDDGFLAYFAARGYHAHAVSLSGHGSSPGAIRWIRSPRLIRDVIDTAERLPNRPVLIGHSMGGYIVQKVLERYTAPAAVLVASLPHYGALPATLRFARRHPLAFVKTNVTLNMRPVVETPALAREHLFWRGTPDAIVAANFPRLQDDSYVLYLDMLALNLPRTRKIKTPMLVLGGAEDGIFKPGEIRATGAAYDAETHIFPNMGHNLMSDAGWENVAAAIAAWLESRHS